MPTIVMSNPDTCSDPATRYAGRDKINVGTASDPIVYAATTPYWIAQGKSDVTVTWVAAVP